MYSYIQSVSFIRECSQVYLREKFLQVFFERLGEENLSFYESV